LDKIDSPALTAKRDELAALTARPEAMAAPVTATMPPRGASTPHSPTGAARPAIGKPVSTPISTPVRNPQAVDADSVTDDAVMPNRNAEPSRPVSPVTTAAVGGRTTSAATSSPTAQPQLSSQPPTPSSTLRTASAAHRQGASAPVAPTQTATKPNPAKVVTASAVSQRGKSDRPETRPENRPDMGTRRTSEPMIYSPPHAPDDPGLDEGFEPPRRNKDAPRDVPRDDARDTGRGTNATVQIRPGRSGR
jgi:hypothetical protein